MDCPKLGAGSKQDLPMSEIPERLKKQAQWQKSRRNLSWPEKVRLAEAIRDSLEPLRRSRSGANTPRQVRRP